MTDRQASHGTRAGYKSGCRCDACRQFQQEYDAARYRKRRDVRLAQVKAWREANRDKVRGYSAAQKARDPERYMATARASQTRMRAAFPEREREKHRRYDESPHGRARRSARMQRRRGVVTDGWTDDYVSILLNDPCCYCGGPGGSIDHIVPISDGGTSEHHNLTSACVSCNSSKRDTDLLGFLSRR